MFVKKEIKEKLDNIKKTTDSIFLAIESIKNLSEEEYLELSKLEKELYKNISECYSNLLT